MFSLNFKGRETSEGNQGISFLTMTISGEAGSDAEIHLVVRDRSKPIEPIFRITAKTAQKGQFGENQSREWKSKPNYLTTQQIPDFQ